MRTLIARLGAGLAAVIALVGATPPARAQEYTAAAKGVIAKARAASGGEAAWNGLRGWHEVGMRDGLRYEMWVDPIRYGHRIETAEPQGRRVRGFNGAAEWQITPQGVVTGVAARAVVAEARTAAFFAASGWLFPSRFAADGDYVGVRQSGGRSFEVLKVHPMGGRPRELWFDGRTHLLARIVDRTGARPVTTELSDYRQAGRVRAAFRVSVEGDEGGGREERRIERLDFAAPDRALFSLARPMPAAPVRAQVPPVAVAAPPMAIPAAPQPIAPTPRTPAVQPPTPPPSPPAVSFWRRRLSWPGHPPQVAPGESPP